MSEPNPSNVSPWYLRNITQALELDNSTGQVHLRTSLTSGANITVGNITVSNVGITSMGNIPLSGNTLPVSGNITVTGNVNANVSGGNVTVSGNVGITGTPNVSISGTPNVSVSGNVGITGTPNVSVSGNVGITGTPNVSVSGNVGITGTPNVSVSGNVGITGTPNVSVNGNVGISSFGNIPISGNTLPVTGNVNANVSGNVSISGIPTVTLGSDSSDAFGRLRVSNPQTLFDTQNRYYDHGQFATSTAGSGNVAYESSSSTFLLNVGTTNGDSAITESYKVFPYQPGKSLLIYATFCMAANKTNQTQRIGYFSGQNGIFFENVGGTYNMVIRSTSSGVTVEDRFPQSQWNGDRMDGNGGIHNPSGITLNPSLDQIWFCDIEWLGVGSVRVGFIVNGQYVNCHTFNHANTPSTSTANNTTTYMTTACLPMRYEIFNTGTVSSNSSFRQICSTVISEGGYALSGLPRSIGHVLTSPIVLPNNNSFLPLMSIRLKSACLDSIVLPVSYTIAPLQQANFKYRIYSRAITTGGTWTAIGANSPVEYNLAPTAISSGDIVTEGFIIASNQTSSSTSQLPFDFSVQLQRNSFTGVAYEFAIAAMTTGTNQNVCSSMSWQECN